jgi:hypothetical protein
MAFKIIDEGDGFYSVKEVPVFEEHSDRGFPCDTRWMQNAIKNHQHYKQNGWRPPIIIGHNIRGGQEKEAVGFLDNLVQKGRRLYADLVRIPREIKEKIIHNAFPSRSVEVLPKSERILALALLGGTAPHFPLPQMTYSEQGLEENSLWYRSPNMDGFSETQKAELSAMIGGAIRESLPDVLATYAQSDDGSEGGEETRMVEFYDPETGQQYEAEVPATEAAEGAVAKGKKFAGKAWEATKGAPGKAWGAAKAHPKTAAGIGAGVATVGIGAAALRHHRKKQQEGYSIDTETGEVCYGGEPLGVVLTYDELNEVGMSNPNAPGDVTEADASGHTVTPKTKVRDTEASGLESGVDDGGDGPDFVDPLNREDSDQFQENVGAELYNLSQEVSTLKHANALLQAGRRAETYSNWLEEQREAGVPVGDIEKTAEFMLSLRPEQIEQFKAQLLAQPKVALGRIESPQTFELDSSLEEARQDYAQHKDEYQALGVSDKDVQMAKFVRSGPGIVTR